MARGHSIEIDLDTAHRLKAQGVSAAEIARRLKLPVSTLKDHLKRTLPAKTTDVYNSGSTEVHTGGSANVHIDIPLSETYRSPISLIFKRCLSGGGSANISSTSRMSRRLRLNAGHCI
jgi:hypothetical protein